jgi:hypothetical protein
VLFPAGHPHQLESLARLGVTLGLAHLALFEPISDVVEDGHVWEQGVLLKDGVDLAPVGGRAYRVHAADQDLALVWLFKTGDQPQGRGLAAARWPQERKELALAYLEADGVYGGERAKALGHSTKLYVVGAVDVMQAHAHITPHCGLIGAL